MVISISYKTSISLSHQDGEEHKEKQYTFESLGVNVDEEVIEYTKKKAKLIGAQGVRKTFKTGELLAINAINRWGDKQRVF